MRASHLRFALALPLLSLTLALVSTPAEARPRWSLAQAQTWHAQQAWQVGANFLPSNASNQLEMWQADSFDPATIEKELAWAEAIGMNTMRVFLHDLLWQQDPTGFVQRIDRFLAIAARHHIKPMFVLFDSVWDPNPKLGLQRAPTPGVHNSAWVQSPGPAALKEAANQARLQDYVTGGIKAFAHDTRIQAWDIWNEPDNSNEGEAATKEKAALVAPWLSQAFSWARSVDPIQPLTSGLWRDSSDWSSRQTMTAIERIQIDESDVISFHNYQWPEEFERRVLWLKQFQRPILCTEYMARSVGSTIDQILPLAQRHEVGAMNWGLVDGKEQTRFPWDSWQHPYIKSEPPVWFHVLLRQDGTAYRAAEVALIRRLVASAAANKNVPAPEK